MDSDFLRSLSQFDDGLPDLNDPQSNMSNWNSLAGMFSFPTLSPLDTARTNTHTRLDAPGDTPDSLVRFLCEQDDHASPSEDPTSAQPSPPWMPAATQLTIGPEGPHHVDTPTTKLLMQAIDEAPNPGGDQSPRIRSINDIEGFSAQYFGLSGESDPYLLKHIKYDGNHERRYFKVHFRKAADAREPPQLDRRGDERAAGTPAEQPAEAFGEVPVQFMMTAEELTQEEGKDTAFRPDVSQEALRKELDALVGPENGIRLINL
ncbi:hypothetical protein A1O1_05736 [Capronia coronata CBS 617.96]|uniref:Uncharacterized protein n=1 Tax=Capronia coronata CBS 617.96 TaxID=1182541 RepID=W9XXY5_9EURO|nr:uncharacterized protein A1O1_05736 [Capronia coronata CBS 617.96]EXJ85372.1 hypothetical protein A1O1_05736 [Capronia coronata CBS 617.96]